MGASGAKRIVDCKGFVVSRNDVWGKLKFLDQLIFLLEFDFIPLCLFNHPVSLSRHIIQPILHLSQNLIRFASKFFAMVPYKFTFQLVKFVLIFVCFLFSSHEPLPAFLNLTNLYFDIISVLPPHSSIVSLFNLLNLRVKHNQLVIAHAQIFDGLSALIDLLTEPILNTLSAFLDDFNHSLKIWLFLTLKLKVFFKRHDFVFQKGDFWLFRVAKMISRWWPIEKSLFMPRFVLISQPSHVCIAKLHH